MQSRVGYTFLCVMLVGCECSTNVGGNHGDAGLDARRVGPRTDECGNGLDDDENGLIDDLCPCAPGETQRCFSGAVASNEIGACIGGTQTCVTATGSEWGDWGDSACAGEVLPLTEACDGSDADCDGAIDEGCPCTDGVERACAEEFLIAPCMAGTQACRRGSWSACEGAVGPSADVCSDSIDNDCDGLTNEGCECAYPLAPEVCRDAVDNDCDGATDEPECTPDWPGDAGVPNDAASDAGCGASIEACGNAFDDDCDSRIDEGCMPVCDGVVAAAPTTFTLDGQTSSFFGERITAVAWNPEDEVLGVAFAWRTGTGGTLTAEEIHLLRFTLDGTLLGTSVLGVSRGNDLGGLGWNGSRWIAVWAGSLGGDRRIFGAVAAADGTPIGMPVALDGATGDVANPAMIAVGAEVFAAWGQTARGGVEPSSVRVRRLDAALGPAGPEVNLGARTGWIDLAWGGDALAVLDVSSARDVVGTYARLSLLVDDAVTSVDELTVRADGSLLLPPALAFGGGGYLACWPGTADPFLDAPMRCVHAGSDGAFDGAAFDASNAAGIAIGDVAFDGCRFVGYTGLTSALSDRSQSLFTVGLTGGRDTVATLSYPHAGIHQPKRTHVVPIDAGALLLVEWARGLSGPDILDVRRVE